ncbi:MAG: AmmeMemoRadiSam system protein B [Deltaproteobacteria bacterium]|nr:AmmeMemoRadiSam system protein B [Deltaproteobacteria bacterium]
MIAGVRKSTIAGSWYPDNPQVLREEIAGFLRSVPDEEVKGVVGLVAPHAGYVYSGQVAAYAYKLIRDRIFDHVIVIAPSHHAFFRGVSLYGQGGYETPLGVIAVDEALAGNIAAGSAIVASLPETHLREHSIEIQLPFLQVAFSRSFRFVPLLMGEQDLRTCEALADSVVGAVGESSVLIVGSSDLSHFHAYEQALKMDGRALYHMEKMDAAGLLDDIENRRCEACGGGPAAVTMMAARRLGADSAKLLKYANSGDVTGDRSSVVGYASAVFYKSVSALD